MHREFFPRTEPCRQSKLYANCQSYLTTVVLTETWLAFWQGFLKVDNKHSSRNINVMFVQSYLVFNVLKTVTQKRLYIVLGTFFLSCFPFSKHKVPKMFANDFFLLDV